MAVVAVAVAVVAVVVAAAAAAVAAVAAVVVGRKERGRRPGSPCPDRARGSQLRMATIL